MLIARICLPYGVTKEQYHKLKAFFPALTPAKEQKDFYIHENAWEQCVPVPMVDGIDCYADEVPVDGQGLILRKRPSKAIKDTYVVFDWYKRNVTVAIDKLLRACPDITFQVVEFLGEEEDND